MPQPSKRPPFRPYKQHTRARARACAARFTPATQHPTAPPLPLPPCTRRALQLYRLRSIALACLHEYERAAGEGNGQEVHARGVCASELCAPCRERARPPCCLPSAQATSRSQPARASCSPTGTPMLVTLCHAITSVAACGRPLAVPSATSFHFPCRLRAAASPAADAERVVELAPHLMDGYYHKGFALYHLKQYAAAVRKGQGDMEGHADGGRGQRVA